MKTLTMLDEHETKMIERHREQVIQAQQMLIKQNSCEHGRLQFLGFSHKETSYKCYDCGKIIFE